MTNHPAQFAKLQAISQIGLTKPNSASPADSHVSVRQVRASYQPSKAGNCASADNKAVLQGIDLEFQRGQVSVIVGPNGCGKSTLLRCLARLHPLDAGSIQIDGKEISKLSNRSAARSLSLLPQSPLAPAGMRVASLVAHGRQAHQSWWQQWSAQDEQAVLAAMQACDVLDLAQHDLAQLSGGQRQRCWLAMALAQETPLLLLDEPTSMLDLGHQFDILQRLRSLARGQPALPGLPGTDISASAPRSIVLVLHDLIAAARFADHLVAMQDGKVIAAGKPQQIVTPQLVQQLYGLEVDVLRAPGDGAPVIVPKMQACCKLAG